MPDYEFLSTSTKLPMNFSVRFGRPGREDFVVPSLSKITALRTHQALFHLDFKGHARNNTFSKTYYLHSHGRYDSCGVARTEAKRRLEREAIVFIKLSILLAAPEGVYAVR